MTNPTSAAKAAKPTKDDFHRERSRFLDAFALLEEASNQRQQSDETLLKQITCLRAIRNDLVHAHLRFTAVDGELHALAINTQEVSKPARVARLVRLDDFSKLRGQLSELTKRIQAA